MVRQHITSTVKPLCVAFLMVSHVLAFVEPSLRNAQHHPNIIALGSETSNSYADGAPLLEVSGFSWVENLVFDGNGNLWASEATSGQLWRVHLDTTGPEAVWNKTLVLDGFRHVDGLVVSSDGNTIYAIAQTHNQSRTASGAMVVSVSAVTPTFGKFNVVARTPDLPNGMKRNLVTNKLYLTVEGQEFLPGQGKVPLLK